MGSGSKAGTCSGAIDKGGSRTGDHERNRTGSLRRALQDLQSAKERPPQRAEASAIVRWTIIITVASWFANAITLWP
jgi:hypothetical protein